MTPSLAVNKSFHVKQDELSKKRGFDCQNRLLSSAMDEQPDQLSYRARLIVAVATVAGFALRIWPVGHLGLNQFDEGIYSLVAHRMSLDFGGRGIDPVLISYAPPGYPLLVGLLSLFVGLSDQTGLLTSAIAGSLTIPFAASISARISGQRAAVITACLLCMAGPHIAFSRMGLTDATFLLCWSMAWLACLSFLRTPGFGNAILMGVLVGIAQEVKYNGWLIGGFALVTAVLGPILSKADRSVKRWSCLAVWGSLAILLAWLVVLPWYQFVETHGGYAALLRHQRSYLGGAAAWWPNLRLQVHQATLFSGSVGYQAATIGLVLWSVWLIQPGRLEVGWRTIVRFICVGCLVGSLANNPVVAGLFGLSLLDVRNSRASRLIAVAWVGLFLLTPFYHPYARLWLPFEFASWILLGGLTAQWADQTADLASFCHGLWVHRLRFACAGIVLVGTLFLGPGFPLGSATTIGHEGLFAASDGLKDTASQIVARLEPEVQEIRTFVRPAMSYTLRGPFQFRPQSDLSQFEMVSDPRAWGLVDSTLLSPKLTRADDPVARQLIASLLGRWEVEAEFWTATSLPTALDLDPARRNYSPANSMACFWLIRPRREFEKR